MGIVLARVDDRLIHGQVMTSWLNYTWASKIIVIDDATANDAFLSMIIKTLVPTVEKSVDVVSKIGDEKVIILAKTPAPYLNLIENGITLPKVNLGGMGSTMNRKTLYRNISASEEEIETFKKIMEHGVDVEIQMVTEDQAINLKKLI